MKKRQVILHLIATNFYGGPEKQILTHARHLDPDRFGFVLVSFVEGGARNEMLERAEALGLETLALPAQNPFDPRLILRLARIIRERQVDLVCCHGYKSNIIGRLATWLCGVPQVAVSRGWTAENPRIRLYERLDRLFLRFDDHVVAVSHGQREKVLRSGVPPRLVSVIHNAIEIDAAAGCASGGIRSELGLPAGAVLVASAGRLSPEKNQAAMIEVAKDVVAADDRVYFAVFGEGVLRPELERRVAEAGLEGRFLLPGFRRDLPAVFQELDIFMLPSFTEGLPNVVLEAFAAKKPVVATRVGGTPEVVKDGVSGFLTDPADVASMTRHVAALAGDAGLRRCMGEAGFDYVQAHFGFAAQTRLYLELYGRLVPEASS